MIFLKEFFNGLGEMGSTLLVSLNPNSNVGKLTRHEIDKVIFQAVGIFDRSYDFFQNRRLSLVNSILNKEIVDALALERAKAFLSEEEKLRLMQRNTVHYTNEQVIQQFVKVQSLDLALSKCYDI